MGDAQSLSHLQRSFHVLGSRRRSKRFIFLREFLIVRSLRPSSRWMRARTFIFWSLKASAPPGVSDWSRNSAKDTILEDGQGSGSLGHDVEGLDG